jgi:hypothetical protein
MKNTKELRDLKSLGFKICNLKSTGGLEFKCFGNREYGIYVKYDEHNDTYVLNKSKVHFMFINKTTFFVENKPLIFNNFSTELLPVINLLLESIKFEIENSMCELEDQGVLFFH